VAAPFFVRGQFNDVADFVAHTIWRPDAALDLHAIEGPHQAILAGAIEGIDQDLAISLGGKPVNVDDDAEQLAQLRARSPGIRLDRHRFLLLGLGVYSKTRKQDEEGDYKGDTEKPVSVSHVHSPLCGSYIRIARRLDIGHDNASLINAGPPATASPLLS